MSKKKATFTEEFKLNIVKLYKNGRSNAQLIKDYNLGSSTVYKWVKEYDKSKSFKAVDNRSAEENELIKLRKINKQLQMENDILKQAALLLGKM